MLVIYRVSHDEFSLEALRKSIKRFYIKIFKYELFIKNIEPDTFPIVLQVIINFIDSDRTNTEILGFMELALIVKKIKTKNIYKTNVYERGYSNTLYLRHTYWRFLI